MIGRVLVIRIFLRKMAKDTDAPALMRWFGADAVRIFRRRRAFDREGIFIAMPPTCLFRTIPVMRALSSFCLMSTAIHFSRAIPPDERGSEEPLSVAALFIRW